MHSSASSLWRTRLVCFLSATILQQAACRAEFVVGTAEVPATGVFHLDLLGVGVVASHPALTGIPRYPASLGLGGGGPFGETTGFLATSWNMSSTTSSVFIPNAPPAASGTFLSQTIPFPLPGPEPGLATLRADFEATFDIDAAGLPAHPIGMAYTLSMIVDGFVGFDAVIDYTSSTAGLLDTLAVHFTRVTPGGFIAHVGDTGALPDLSGLSTLTLSGHFQLQVNDNPGGSSTEIDVTSVPEPASLMLAILGVFSVLGFGRGLPLRGADSRGGSLTES